MNRRFPYVGAAVRVFALTGFACIFLCGNALAERGEPGIVRGVVWTSENAPVPDGNVRLRNLETGRIVSTSETSTTGQFVFGEVVRNSYLVELVSETGKVLAVGPSFRVGPGETVSTVVRLPSRRSWYGDMFSNSAAAVIAAASSVGITAVGSQARPISPQ